MSRRTEIVATACTVAFVAAIGLVIQSSDTEEMRYGDARLTQEIAHLLAAPLVFDAADDQVAMDVSVTRQASSYSRPSLPQLAEIEFLYMPDPPIIEPKVQPDPRDCSIVATAKVQPGAMIALELSAACRPRERVAVYHSGMVFTASTDADGQLRQIVPALDVQAEIVLTFPDGEEAVTQVQVIDINRVNRVVLQYEHGAGFELHAREFGAAYGAYGHVSARSHHDIKAIINGTGGYITTLGTADEDGARLVEIYTLPADMSVENGQVDLSIEAMVTAENCGGQVQAQTLALRQARPLATRDLSIVMPPCEAVGDFLVLNNPFEHLKIASR